MNISMSSLMAGIIFGIVGLYLFRAGRKSSHVQFILIGLALMIYPYFTSSPIFDWGIGFGLCGVAYYFRHH